MAYIEVEPGIRLFVQDTNPGYGSPILFIHGWPLNQEMFEYQTTQLPKYGFRCIGLDLRGYGRSDRPWYGYTYDRMADDIRVVIDTLRLQDAALAGFSMGGAISIRYMARHGGHGISRLALLSAAAPRFTRSHDFPYGTPVEEVNALIDGIYRDRPQTLQDFGAKFFASPIKPAFRHWFEALTLNAANHATAQCAMALRDEDLRGDLPQIRVPTGIFHGVQDQICPFPLALLMHQWIRGSQLFRFERSGHAVYYDELEAFNGTFLRFLTSQP